MLEIITFGNYNGPVDEPQTLLVRKFYRWLKLKVQQMCFTTKPLYMYAKKPALLPLVPKWQRLIHRDSYFIVIHYLHSQYQPSRGTSSEPCTVKPWFDTGSYRPNSGPLWNSNFIIEICKPYSAAVSTAIQHVEITRYAAAYEYWLWFENIVINYWRNINHRSFMFNHTGMHIWLDVISFAAPCNFKLVRIFGTFLYCCARSQPVR